MTVKNFEMELRTEEVEVKLENVTVKKFLASIDEKLKQKNMKRKFSDNDFIDPLEHKDIRFHIGDGVKSTWNSYDKVIIHSDNLKEYQTIKKVTTRHDEIFIQDDHNLYFNTSETHKTLPYDRQISYMRSDGLMENEICDFILNNGKKGIGYYCQKNRLFK